MTSCGLSSSAARVLLLVTAASVIPVSPRAEDSIQLVGRMRVARAAATATAIAGNPVLIAGGMTEGGGALREFEIFDASANRVVASGEMDEARVSHSATRLSDGRVLILGGYNGTYLKSALIFDPRTGRFAAAAGNTCAITSRNGLRADFPRGEHLHEQTPFGCPLPNDLNAADRFAHAVPGLAVHSLLERGKRVLDQPRSGIDLRRVGAALERDELRGPL